MDLNVIKKDQTALQLSADSCVAYRLEQESSLVYSYIPERFAAEFVQCSNMMKPDSYVCYGSGKVAVKRGSSFVCLFELEESDFAVQDCWVRAGQLESRLLT